MQRMETSLFEKITETSWRVRPRNGMRVPAIIYATERLIKEMDNKVYEQVTNVATLPGIVRASYALPDAHSGYGFPIGAVAAFDPQEGGVVSAGGVGFDISCGVRTHLTLLTRHQVLKVQETLAQKLYEAIPAGLGSKGTLKLDDHEMTQMLIGGAKWALENGYGCKDDLVRIEENGCQKDADPAVVSEHARKRQLKEMGTLGSGNHYLEVQEIKEIFDKKAADAFGLKEGECVVSIHCGSRGLGHQIGTDFLREMVVTSANHKISIPDRELACAPLKSELGQRYLGAMRCAINCAIANRQIIGHLTRQVFAHIFQNARLPLLFDISHNTCKIEPHKVNGEKKDLYIHRKGATRSFGPDHPSLPEELKKIGQPVLIGGTMGTESYILVGTTSSESRAFSSACHGAGRLMSRHQAGRTWQGETIVKNLKEAGIIIKSVSLKGIAEEAPSAYKNVKDIADAAEAAGLARNVAKLVPLICIKG